MLTEDGPKVIEMAARLGGGFHFVEIGASFHRG